MGLDMYFLEVWDVKPDGTFQERNLKYFRKHSDLNGWLAEEWESNKELYNYELSKNSDDSYSLVHVGDSDNADFDCCYMLITPELVEKLKKYVHKGEFKQYRGFFWGESSFDQWEETLKLIYDIEKIFKDTPDHKVFYHPWW